MADDTTLAGSVLSEPTVTWDSPGAPTTGLLPTPGIKGTIRTDITRQYVAATPNQWFLNLVRVLPFSIDDITVSFGDDLYERFLFDAIVAAAVTTFKASILEDGMSFQPAVSDDSDPNYKQATQYVQDAERMVDDLDTSLDDWLWNMADALALGNKVSEITYRVDRSAISGKQQYVLDSLRVKPRRSTAFAVDTYRKVIGLMALIPGVGMPVQAGNVVVDPASWPNLLPREKFAVFTHRQRDEDPRGTSVLRAAYTAWNLKMQLWGQYQKWLVQFASPSLLGFTAQNAMAMPMVDALGNPLLGTDGAPLVAQSPEEAMLNTLIAFASGSAAVFPFGADVKPIEMRGQGAPFLQAFRMLNEEMTTAIHGQSMTSMQPKQGTQALGTVQENTFETLVHQAKASIIRMVRRDILRPWVRYNHGAAAEWLAPTCSLGQTEAEDWQGDITAAATAGYQFDPSQMAGLDKRFGAPPRDPDWQEKAQQDAAAQQQIAAKVKQQTGIGLAPGNPPAKPGADPDVLAALKAKVAA